MRIIFLLCGCADRNPDVRRGLGAPQHTAACLSYNYTHEPAWRKNTITHVCNVTGLVPDTLYVYQVGSVSDGFSALLNFTSPKPAGAGNISLILFAAAD